MPRHSIRLTHLIVALLEPTDHVGGVNTGGLSFSDSNQTVRSTVIGLFDEWHTRIEKDYASRGVELPYKVSIKDQAQWTYEPHVAARVTKQMLDEANVEVLTNRFLQSVAKKGTHITALVTSNGTFTAKVFIDATYEGDLMAAAGVSWTIGREGPAEFGESLAGKRYPKSKMPISSIRVEPTWMILGQSAGIAAALSARDELSVQNLPYPQLRNRLLAQGQVLDLPAPSDLPPTTISIDPKTLPGIVLDNTSAKLAGDWARSSNFKPHIGNGYVHDGRRADGKATATFRFRAPKAGRYQLLMAYSAHETRAQNVPVAVFSGLHKTTLTVDQTTPLPGAKLFRPIDTIDLQADVETTITITNANTNGFVILDALQLLPVE